ncbi:MAG: hypothetical protein MJ213_02125 [Bacilli bacterium]|nr:hypothetical protein [Bacilli bacterium]
MEEIAVAKREGKYKGIFKDAVVLVRLGEKSATSVAREFKISYMTYFRWAKGLDKKNKKK